MTLTPDPIVGTLAVELDDEALCYLARALGVDVAALLSNDSEED